MGGRTDGGGTGTDVGDRTGKEGGRGGGGGVWRGASLSRGCQGIGKQVHRLFISL